MEEINKTHKNKGVVLEDIDPKEFDESEYSEYTQNKEVLFAFIDVLGFKQTFDDIKISNNMESSKKFNDVFAYYFELLENATFYNSKECYAGQTSDTLYFYTQNAGLMLEFIKLFLEFSLYAMTKDVFFRGGIAKGDLYRKEKYQFYGDCIIGAYLLESEISKNPIITIDRKTDEALSEFEEYKKMVKTSNDRKYLNPFALIGDDSIVIQLKNPKALREYSINEIEEQIEKNCNGHEFIDNTYRKYQFLKRALSEQKNGGSCDGAC